MELILKNVSKKFKDVVAVDNISLDFQSGIYGLLGANGAGKTTLLRMICSILRPTNGLVLFDKKLINSLGEKYRDIIGFLPQDFGYYDNFSAYKFLRYIALVKGIETKMIDSKISNVLDLVNLTSVKDRKIKTFSGGMKRRLGIAQAVINDPKILVLDEPTVGLDPKERVKFRNIISNMSKNKIIILSTHIVADVEYISDKIIVMKDGKVILNDVPNAIMKNIDNKVWICNILDTELQNIETKFNIVNINRVSPTTINVRIISDTKPCDSACAVTPTLEDLYLYYFPVI